MNDYVVDSGLLPMDGVCDEGFAPVREAFIRNFTELGEPGAAIALFVGGRLVSISGVDGKIVLAANPGAAKRSSISFRSARPCVA